MRFYPVSKPLRIFITVLWSVLVLASLLSNPRQHPWHTLLWLSVAIVQISSSWTAFWESTPDALVQHGLFRFRRSVPWSAITYAGPVRRQGIFASALRRSIELAASTLPSPLYVSPGRERQLLLATIRQNAPQAEVLS